MGHLIPQQRTDKLGRTIVRHMRPDAQKQTSSKPIPAPSASKSRSLDRPFTPEETDRVIKKLLKRTGIAGRLRTNFKGEGIAENTLRYIASRAPEELRKFDKETRGADPWVLRNWAEHLNQIEMTPSHKNPDEDMLPDFLQTKVIVEQISALTQPAHSPNLAMRSSTMRTLRGVIDKSDYDTVRAAMLAVYIMPRRSVNQYTDLDYARDSGSIEYIKKHYDAVMERREILRERGSIDPEAIEMIINADTPALAEGIL